MLVMLILLTTGCRAEGFKRNHHLLGAGEMGMECLAGLCAHPADSVTLFVVNLVVTFARPPWL